MDHRNEFEGSFPKYANAFGLIGQLELALRWNIPTVLKSSQESSTWYERLRLKERRLLDLNRALGNSSEFPEQYLPFSFWRHLLSAQHYGDLWLPHLYKVFGNIENPKDFNTFTEIDKAMDSAYRLRNNLAHFNIQKLRTIDFATQRVEWLLEMMID